VEVHLRASSWSTHGHAADAAYGRVVLHVVQTADALALDRQGAHVPTVLLEPRPGRQRQWHTSGPERGGCVREPRTVLQVVQAAGLERFRARVDRFEGDLNAIDADQVIWRAVAEAAGFTPNAGQFARLAEAVPWAEAATVVIERGPVGLSGLLLGTAGLLAEANLPEAHAWRALQRTRGARRALSAGGWDRRQVRARNAPVERCRGLAELAARWTMAGRWPGPAEQARVAVAQAVGLRRPELWRFSVASPWIGRGRAQVMVVNVLLPLAAALGVSEAKSLFERLPGEPSNRAVRYMAGQLAAPGVQFYGACQQQGLLQLFKATCAARVCERCPARAGGLNNLGRSATTAARRPSKDRS
jgi:hypothetical protein